MTNKHRLLRRFAPHNDTNGRVWRKRQKNGLPRLRLRGQERNDGEVISAHHDDTLSDFKQKIDFQSKSMNLI
jgi:hypothetical protein